MPSVFQRLRSWFSRKPEPDVRRNLILFDVTQTSSMSQMVKAVLCQMLHDKAVERGLSASLVDFEKFIRERLLLARKFDGSGKRMEEDLGMTGIEEMTTRSDIMWLMRNRDRLMREACAAGGDAEYVFMQFQGNPSDYLFGMQWELNKRVIKLQYIAHEDTNEGNYVAVLHAGQTEFFKMSEDNWHPDDVLPILNHIVRICEGQA